MINLSTPSKKDISRIVEKFSTFLSGKLNFLNVKNFSRAFKALIFDKRFIITCAIIFFTTFAHLASPAFYKLDWIEQRIKKQLENEFNISLEFQENAKYSMFPVPNFSFKKVKLSTNDKNSKEVGILENLTIFLSYDKFFVKDKMNIQYIKIKNSQFSIYDKNIDSLKFFFDNEINKKKLTILNSKIFFKDNSDDIYSILNINKSVSYLETETNLNHLRLNGNIFNNPIVLKIKNNFNIKYLNVILDFPKLQKKILMNSSYLGERKNGDFLISGIGKNHSFKYIYDDNKLKIASDKNVNNSYVANGEFNFKPFTSKLNVRFKSLDLFDLVDQNNFFYGILRNGILFNENLNYTIEVHAEELKNHRKLKNLYLISNFNQQKLNFDDSSLTFEDILKLNISNSTYINDLNGEFFFCDIILDIIDSNKLYSYFQTKKKYRKKINKIKLEIKYNFLENFLMINNVYVDDETSEQIETFLNSFNSDKKVLKNRIDIKNFFNVLVELI